MATFLDMLIDHRKRMTPPEHIQMTAEIVWKPRHRETQFLDTVCFLTTYAARDLLAPDSVWKYVDELPTGTETFEVVFGEDGEEHSMFVHKGIVYQSYAFKHGVRASPILEKAEWWEMVSHNAVLMRDQQVGFYIPYK